MRDVDADGPITVLVADDDPAMQRMLSLKLSIEGMLVVGPAGTGSTALQMARLHQPLVAIVDPHSLKMGGFATIPAIRAESPQTSVVVHAALGPTAAGIAFELGADRFLRKGDVTPNELVRALRAAAAHAA